jgi:hypothetical protein
MTSLDQIMFGASCWDSKFLALEEKSPIEELRPAGQYLGMWTKFELHFFVVQCFYLVAAQRGACSSRSLLSHVHGSL